MAVMFRCLDISSDISEETEIFCVLARTKYIPYLMITDNFLEKDNI